jgi:hypothetical protein
MRIREGESACFAQEDKDLGAKKLRRRQGLKPKIPLQLCVTLKRRSPNGRAEAAYAHDEIKVDLYGSG